jgi:hypothetical protein
MRWQTLSFVASIAGVVISAPASGTNTTTEPCGLITQQFIEYYKNSSSMFLCYGNGPPTNFRQMRGHGSTSMLHWGTHA